MTRLLLIPVTGTAAALLVILLAHRVRETSRENERPAIDWPQTPEHQVPADEPETEPEPEPESEPTQPPAPEPREYQIELEKSGTFVDLESGTKYASAKELGEQLGTARHTLFIANGDGVTEATLDEALANLRDRFQVRKVYRAPEAPPGEGR